MGKVRTKIGDVFSVKINDKQIKYFQLIAFDLIQLNSDVIRAFKRTYLIADKPNILDVVADEVEFYTHCVTNLGIKMNLWEKEGNVSNVGEISAILFRSSRDSGSKIGEQVAVSNNWYVWKLDDKDFRYVGKLKGENRQAELGPVVNPYDVVERIKTGKFSFFYPAFE